MALEAHLNELKLKHKEMEAEINSESKFPSVDQSKISGLKRRKMRIKQEISTIETRLVS